MPERLDSFANARNLAVDILRQEKAKTVELIRATAVKAARAQQLFDPDASVDVDRLTAELRHLFSISVEDATVLEEAEDHQPWLPSSRAGIQWRFWNRYMTYLERDFGMAPAAVNSLDDLTGMILERLEEPGRNPPWDRRGMVVGSVQSGKTANYTGLVCKALDAGYKLVVVLAGIHNNLRSQTQLRIDEGVLGFDTKTSRRLNTANRWIGVGRLPGEKPVIHSLTSSEEIGDFNDAIANNIGVMLGSDPVVLVMKKHSSLLQNLLDWVTGIAGTEEPGTGKRIVRDVPLLLIDDEADNASINTKAKPGDQNNESVTAINGKIRKLLDAFEKSAYVGYTATPFANIFINPEAETPAHGKDLFPRSFIINVKPPTNYIGPEKVFGLDGDPDAGIAGSTGLPVVREIADYETAFPPKHPKDYVVGALPGSLMRAVRCFILTCAARRARGQDRKHNSMLVHVTRFVAVQQQVVELIRQELKNLQLRIEMGDGRRTPTLIDELEALWNEEFVPVSRSMAELSGAHVNWKEVRDQLHAAAAKIQVVPINSFAKVVLDYKEHELDGRSVIAVGGNKLSRGLTLEGLSISYFLRTTRMYDTLMQMGRWFGYRPGYLDLCRLYTTRVLKDWYRHVALAETELRREFDYMVAAGLTPENYGLRVRTHPDGMIITALNKMSHGRTLELSWAGVLSQTTQLPKAEAMIAANLSATSRLLAGLPSPGRGGGAETRVWTRVPADRVAGFVESLQFPAGAARASGGQLAGYIRKQAEKSPAELTHWTVALLSNSQAPGDRRQPVAGFEIGLIERTPESQTSTSFELKKSNILSPKDEGLDFVGVLFDRAWFDAVAGKGDLSADREWLIEQIGRNADAVALDLTLRWQEGDSPRIKKPVNGETSRANGRVLRVLRRPECGLLLIYPVQQPVKVDSDEGRKSEKTGLDMKGPPVIGVALSFPTSDTVKGVEYRVAPGYWGSEVAEDDRYDD